MRATKRREICHWLASIATILCCSSATDAAEAPLRFAEQVQPILSEFCFQCHGPDSQARQADLRLDVREHALRTEQPVIAPGNSADSELIRRIVSDDPEQQMPPPKLKRALNEKQIATLRQWIDEGAEWGQHWAYDPIRKPRVSASSFGTLVRHPIDVFLGQRLEREGLTFSELAPKSTWLRRVTLDLTGLPPSRDDGVSFEADANPDAADRSVDRLLASAAYGERFVWDWLDAARYADSNGYQGDAERTMWPWRDWAVRAWNADMPFDQFTVWQLAGDLAPQASDEQRLATGFCRNHMINGEGGRIPAENRVDYVMDMTETMGTVWLGLTLNCCRCHDHKFDPLKQRDYYGLASFFNNTPVDGGGGDPQTRPNLETPSEEQQRQLRAAKEEITRAAAGLDELERRHFPRGEGQTAADASMAQGAPGAILEILKSAPANRDRGQLEKLNKQFAERSELNEYGPALLVLKSALERRDGVARAIPRVMIMEEMPQPREMHVLFKGLYDKPTEKVETSVPQQLAAFQAEWPKQRWGLAQWLVSAEQPLTARVIVNRFWSQLFGVGIVKTSEDFGVQGEMPQHPQLLDWLASSFRQSGWDVKRLFRQMSLSHAYAQSSRVSPELTDRDPENRWLARGPRGRLPAWMLRDQALALAGMLSRPIGGPPVKPYQPLGIWEETTFGNKRYEQDHGENLYRRSVYTFWRRIIGPPIFFDSASRQTCTVKQSRTNTPLHALLTLNDVTYIEAARGLADRMLNEVSSGVDARIDQLFQTVLLRSPTTEEREVLTSAFRRMQGEFSADTESAVKLIRMGEWPQADRGDAAEFAAWIVVCNSILNLDEVLCKE